RRDMALSLLRPLGAVLRPALATVLDALSVEGAADDVVAHARKVLDATAADHDHRVLLQVMTLARDVGHDLVAVGQPHLGDLAKRRVRLLRGRGVDAGADAALLRACLQGRHLVARPRGPAALGDQLIDGGHVPNRLLERTIVRSDDHRASIRMATRPRRVEKRVAASRACTGQRPAGKTKKTSRSTSAPRNRVSVEL